MEHTAEEIAAKIDSLGMWDTLAKYNFAVKPLNTPFRYFFSAKRDGDGPAVKRIMLFEGWRTFSDYVHLMADRNAGLFTTPLEFPHFELVAPGLGGFLCLRFDPGYVPAPPEAGAASLCAKILWQAYGLAMRMENDEKLPLAYADGRALFSRIETEDGKWEDAPFPIPEETPQKESISIPSDLVKKAKDLPLDPAFSVEIDFRAMPNLVTQEPRKRYAYHLAVADGASGAKILSEFASVRNASEVRGAWLDISARTMALFVRIGRVPSEIKVLNQRMMRVLRPVGMELPVKISLHDSLLHIERLFKL